MACENYSQNGTSILDNDQPTHWLYTFVAVVVTILILGNNTVTLFVIAKEKSFWNPSGYFMGMLAITDITTGFFLTLFSIPASIVNEWPFGEVFCNIAGLMGTSGGSLSISTLALIAYDRFLIITKPLHYETIMTSKKAIICLVAVWVFNLTFQSIPFAVPSWTKEQKYLYFPNAFVCTLAFHNNVPYVLLTISLIFIPASGIINYCGFKMFITARAHAKAIQQQSHAATSPEAKRSAKNLKSLKTVTLIVGAFFLAWGSFAIFCLYRATLPCDEMKDVPRALEFTIGMFAMSNSFVNFFIYAVRNRKFRESAKKVLCIRKCIEFKSKGESTSVKMSKVHPSSST